MPRKPRIISSSGIYHIILRSVNQQIIFEEEADYRKFLYIISDCKTKYDVDIYAFCLMDNHIHLALHSPPNALGNYFQSVGSRFVLWYNKKYHRYGHLFQGRFHSIAIESNEHFLQTLVYIHNNPVVAGACRFPSEYRWSSFNAFYGAKNPMVNTDFSYSITGSKRSLQQYFAEKSPQLESNDHSGKYDLFPPKHLLTDEQALVKFKSLIDTSAIGKIRDLNKSERNSIIRLLRIQGLTLKQISRVTGVPTVTVQRICG